MKLIKKNLPSLTGLLITGMVFGTLLWELLTLLMERAGFDLNLTLGPVGFDVTAIAIWIQVNPGSVLGMIGGIILFRKI